MTIKITFFMAVAAAALAIGVAGAIGEDDLGQPADAVAYFHANELATAAFPTPAASVAYFRANELNTAASQPDASYSASKVPVTPETAVAASAIDSGRGIEWLQVGVGLGLGIALMLGVWLGLRFVRRPGALAH